MARIRYLKPDFFKDEDLKELPYEVRLFYAGLWCYADKEGRLEDRPERLKIEILPYDKINPEKILTQLTKNKRNGRKPFILRYEINGEKYIQILQWHKHQKPHHTEKDSEIPAPTREQMYFNSELTDINPLQTAGEGKGEGEGEGEGKISSKEDIYIVLLDFWNLFKERGEVSRHNPKGVIWENIKKEIDKLLKKGEGEEDIRQGMENYLKIIGGKQYYFKYAWNMDEFLRRKNGYPVFKGDFGKLHSNYLKREIKSQESRPGIDVKSWKEARGK